MLGLIPFLSASNSKVRLFSKVFAKSLFRWLVSVRSVRSCAYGSFDAAEVFGWLKTRNVATHGLNG